MKAHNPSCCRKRLPQQKESFCTPPSTGRLSGPLRTGRHWKPPCVTARHSTPYWLPCPLQSRKIHGSMNSGKWCGPVFPCTPWSKNGKTASPCSALLPQRPHPLLPVQPCLPTQHRPCRACPFCWQMTASFSDTTHTAPYPHRKAYGALWMPRSGKCWQSIPPAPPLRLPETPKRPLRAMKRQTPANNRCPNGGGHPPGWWKNASMPCTTRQGYPFEIPCEIPL